MLRNISHSSHQCHPPAPLTCNSSADSRSHTKSWGATSNNTCVHCCIRRRAQADFASAYCCWILRRCAMIELVKRYLSPTFASRPSCSDSPRSQSHYQSCVAACWCTFGTNWTGRCQSGWPWLNLWFFWNPYRIEIRFPSGWLIASQI